MAAAAHIRTAQQQGAKAGFTAYMRTSAPTATERQDDIRSAGNRKAQFERYCVIFADQLGANPRTTVARTERDEDKLADLLASADDRETLIQRLTNVLLGKTENTDEDESDGIQVVESKPKTRKAPRKPATAKVESNSVGLSVGDSFLYHGTNVVSEWEVTKVTSTAYKASNGTRISNWKFATVAKLVKSGKIDLI